MKTMKSKKLNELSLDELKSKEKSIQTIVLVLGSFMIIASVILIYVAITTKKPSLTAVSMGCFATLLPILIVLKQIKDEIKSRIPK